MDAPLRPSTGRVAAALFMAAAMALNARRALANGAFPDSQSVLAPAGRSHEIVLGTNFGVITTDDDGHNWTWSCEQDLNAYRDLYQFGAPPRYRLYARDVGGLVFTDDGGCSWSLASGSALSEARISDAFPDPTNADRVLAVVTSQATPPAPDRVVESSNAGTTFTTVRYTAGAGEIINGIEIARSDSRTAYLTILGTAPFAPKLVRTGDAGSSWMPHDLSGTLGTSSVLLIAVDPTDAMRVFLRVNATGGHQLAITDDGGASLRVPLTLAGGGVMTAFVRMGNGTILVAGVVGVDPVLYRSKDGGVSFQPLANPPMLKGLAERDGTVFGTGPNNGNFAVGSSTDEGDTWQPIMQYTDVKAIDGCVKTACQASCLTQVDYQTWPEEVCSATAPPRPAPDASTETPTDAGAGGAAGGGGTGGGARDAPIAADGGGGRGPGVTDSSGCSCAAAGSSWTSGQALLGLVLLLSAIALRRARRASGP